MEQKHFFTRCVLCNNNNYIILTKENVKDISTNIKTTANINISNNYAPADYYEDEEDYEGFDDGFGYDDKHLDHYDPPAPLIVWKHLEGGDVNMKNGCTRDGVELLIKDIPDDVITRQDEFYGCSNCGKVFWQGSHWQRVKDQLK